jgi:nucleotide-binding universal stress UspA family protein
MFPFPRTGILMHTMRIVVGVDGAGAYESALAWVRSLQFEQPQVILVSVVEPPRPPIVGVVAPFSEEASQQSMQVQAESLQKRLDTVQQQLQADGFTVETALLYGQASTKLLDLADERSADLVVLGATRKGTLQALLVGSVARAALVHARQSLLIAHTPPANQPLHAVLATDHSEYNYRCIERLVQFAPQGIRRIAITTAFDLDEETLLSIARAIPAAQESGVDWVVEHLHERNRQVCERLRFLNAACESVVVEGLPIPAIREALRATESQLLILGARGHSLLERLSLGSVSYHFAIGEAVNMLLLRALE